MASEETKEPVPILGIAVFSLYCGLGIASVIFGALPMIVSHLKLEEPYPKVAAIIGAVIAMLFFEVPDILVVSLFITGVVIAEGCRKKRSLWLILGQAGLLGLSICVGFLVYLAYSAGTPVVEYWANLVTGFVSQIQESLPKENQTGMSWETLTQTLIYEGAFYVLSAWLVSTWLSIGLASHLQWFPHKHPFSGPGLRRIQLPYWVSILFLVVLISKTFSVPDPLHTLSGILTLLISVMFVQLCIVTSEFLAKRKAGIALRALVFGLLFSTAVIPIYEARLLFLLLLILGALRPWMFRQRSSLGHRPIQSEVKNEMHT